MPESFSAWKIIKKSFVTRCFAAAIHKSFFFLGNDAETAESSYSSFLSASIASHFYTSQFLVSYCSNTWIFNYDSRFSNLGVKIQLFKAKIAIIGFWRKNSNLIWILINLKISSVYFRSCAYLDWNFSILFLLLLSATANHRQPTFDVVAFFAAAASVC